MLSADMIYRVDVCSLMQLPSPNKLKNKIIIKAKKMRPPGDLGVCAIDSKLDDTDDQEELNQSEDQIDGGKKLKKVLSKKLSKMVNICEAVKFSELLDERDIFYRMSSLSEGKAARFIVDSPQSFVEHTAAKLIRIYPSGIRTSSSNFNPVPFWNMGCQIGNFIHY